jgi:hypothetical protein
LWDLLSFKEILLFEGLAGDVDSVKFATNRKIACFRVEEKKVYFWNIENKELYHCIIAHK